MTFEKKNFFVDQWNDQTIFFHVATVNGKFAVSQWPNFHPFNLLNETPLYRCNAILEISYSRLKKIIRDSRIMVDKKAFDFVLSWTFVQKFLLASRCALLKKMCGMQFPHQIQRKTDSSTTGVPKLSQAMYHFSIWIDEHVPLNMGAGSIFFREGPIMEFPGFGHKYFAGGNRSGKITFWPLET